MFRWWRACSTTPGELSTTDPAPRTDMHRHHHRPTATVPSRILAASLQTTHARQNSRPSALGTGYWVPQCGRTRLSARLGSAHSCYLAWVSQFKLTGKMPNSLSDLADGSAILEVQHNPDTMQHATCNLQQITCNICRSTTRTCNMQHAACKHSTYGAEHAGCNVQQIPYNIHHALCRRPGHPREAAGGTHGVLCYSRYL